MKRPLMFIFLLFCITTQAQYQLKIPLSRYTGQHTSEVVPYKDNDLFISSPAQFNTTTFNVSRAAAYGVAHFNIPSWSWRLYKNHNASVAYQYITDILVTPAGKVWLSALNGLFYLDPQDTTRNQYFTKSNSALINDTVLCLTLVNNDVWAVTRQGISVYNGVAFTNFPASAHPALKNHIWQAVTSTSGEVFMASSKGLVHYSNSNFNLLDSSNSVLKSNTITALYAGKNNKVWIGTAGVDVSQSLYSFHQSLEQVMPRECSALTGIITSIAEDYQGDIVINSVKTPGHQSLYAYKPSSNRIQRISDMGYSVFSDPGSVIYAYPDYKKDTLYVLNASILVQQAKEAQNKVYQHLDINNVSVPILTGGDFGWTLGPEKLTAQAPKGSCKSNMFAGALWLGAMVDNNLHMAAQTYRQNGNDYYPGPVNKGFSAFNKETTSKFSRLWKIEKTTIDLFKADFARGQVFAIDEAILTWPAQGNPDIGQLKNMAPFVDANNDGKYNPYDGDYPDIKGDMSIFWVMNDANNIHSETNSIPLQFEIHGMAYSYVCNDVKTGSADEAVNNTIFLQYRIVNRSNNAYNGIRSALWLDSDIGNDADDFVGCNPKTGYGFGYNGDSFDEGVLGYGAFPPTTAVVPLANDSSKSALSNFHYYQNDFGLTGNPGRPEHYWHYLNSRFKDGTRVTYGGTGRDASSTDYTNYMFPGKDDVNGRPEWSERTAGILPQDRRFIAVGHVFDLQPDEDTTITYAIVYSHATDSTAYPAPALNKLEQDVKKIKGWYARNSFPACEKPLTGLKENKSKDAGMSLSVYPNPAGNTIGIKHDNRQPATLNIFDLGGKLLKTQANVQQSETINISELKPGFYIIQMQAGERSKSFKLIKL